MSHTRWVFWHKTETLSCPLTNILGFREGESHAPTPKFIFKMNQDQKKTFYLICLYRKIETNVWEDLWIFSCYKCVIQLNQLTLFCRIFCLGDLLFFMCLIGSVFFKVFSWMLLLSWKDKSKTCPNHNFGGFPSFGRICLIKCKTSISFIS